MMRLSLFFVNLKLQTNKKDIYDCENLCYHKIKAKHPGKKISATMQKLSNFWSYS